MITVKSIYKQVKLNFSYIAKHALTYTGSIIAIIELLGFLCDFDMVFPEDLTFTKRLLISTAVVISIWGLLFIVGSIAVLIKNQIVVIDGENGHHVYVEYGDILEDHQEKCAVVIAVNRCFDTVVDDDLISEMTIHGKAVQKICRDGYTAYALNDALSKDLSDNQHAQPDKILSRTEKRKGNLQRYPVGTIAEFIKKPDEKTRYFFVGMSAFNSGLHAETTDEEYALTIQRLIEYCHLRSQGLPIYMPVIGIHGLNNKKNERELLLYMVNAFRFNKHLINADIHIVVYSGHRNEVSLQGL